VVISTKVMVRSDEKVPSDQVEAKKEETKRGHNESPKVP